MNTTKDAPGRDEIDEIEALLPWHAAGTLSRRDSQRVDDALAGDPELARRYALVREELGETIRLNETLGAPSARAMEKLFAQIDAEPKRRATPSLNLGARVSEFFAGLTPRKLAWSASAAAVVLVVQAGVIANLVLIEPQQAQFKTASAPPSAPPATTLTAPQGTKLRGVDTVETAPAAAPGVGAFTLIRFAPQATVDDVNRFLENHQLSIVAGPAPGGLYRVRVADTALGKDELASRLKELQADKTVEFIAPTQ